MNDIEEARIKRLLKTEATASVEVSNELMVQMFIREHKFVALQALVNDVMADLGKEEGESTIHWRKRLDPDFQLMETFINSLVQIDRLVTVIEGEIGFNDPTPVEPE